MTRFGTVLLFGFLICASRKKTKAEIPLHRSTCGLLRSINCFLGSRLVGWGGGSLNSEDHEPGKYWKSSLLAYGVRGSLQNYWLICYPPNFTMLPMIIFGKKYCRSSKRAKQELQEQSSNTEEQELRAMPNLNTSIIIIKHLSF